MTMVDGAATGHRIMTLLEDVFCMWDKRDADERINCQRVRKSRARTAKRVAVRERETWARLGEGEGGKSARFGKSEDQNLGS